MTVCIVVAAIVSALAAFRFRIAAFAIFCVGVSVCVFLVQIAVEGRISAAFGWSLLFLGAMQTAYLAGALAFSSVKFRLSKLYLRVGKLIDYRT